MCDNNRKSLTNVWWFVALTLLCSVIAWKVMQTANNRLEETHSVIISHQTNSIKSVDSLLAVHRNILNDSVHKINKKEIESLTNTILGLSKSIAENNNSERIVNLLESELSKIQSEYEVLNLWCALLTIVFLIFSFFSIFKANEMANQSEEALKDMRKIERDVQSKSESIDNKINETQRNIENLTQSISSIESDQNNLSTTIKTLKETEVEGLKTQIGDFNDSLSNIREAINATKNDFNNYYDGKKTDFGNFVSIEVDDSRYRINEMIQSSFEDKNESLLKRLDQIEVLIGKLSSDFQELTTDDMNPDEIEAEEEADRNIDEDDETEVQEVDPDTSNR